MTAGGKPGTDDARRRELDAAGRVAAGLLHEFRNVLNPIVSAAWLLEANAMDPEKVRELARRIDGFAKAEARIAAKMRELLDREAAGGTANSQQNDDAVRSASSTSSA
jgi:nitrogen-specific signal transduction histidine kinase